MACTFSASQLPRVIRTCSVLYILTCKCASRHNGVQLFISHLARWLRTHRFSEPTFRPSASGARNHWKNTVMRDFPTFSRTCIFFLLTLSLLWSFTWAFQLLKNICRFAQSQAFHQIYGRIECFPKKLGVVCHGCVSHRRGPVFSPVTCFQNMEPHIQVSFCLISGSQNYTNSPDSWTCGRLRGFCKRFADFCRRFAGNFGRSYVHFYMRWCSGYENGLVCLWDTARMQTMFSHIQNVNCGDCVAARKKNQAN